MKEFANEMLRASWTIMSKIMLFPVLTNFWTISSNCEFAIKSNFFDANLFSYNFFKNSEILFTL